MILNRTIISWGQKLYLKRNRCSVIQLPSPNSQNLVPIHNSTFWWYLGFTSCPYSLEVVWIRPYRAHSRVVRLSASVSRSLYNSQIWHKAPSEDFIRPKKEGQQNPSSATALVSTDNSVNAPRTSVSEPSLKSREYGITKWHSEDRIRRGHRQHHRLRLPLRDHTRPGVGRFPRRATGCNRLCHRNCCEQRRL
jgi:hypothetical protein